MSFVVSNGQYEFLRMSFALCVTSTYFKKYINAVFAGLITESIIIIYMDDFIIP